MNASHVPTAANITLSKPGALAHSDAVTVLPVPTIEYHRPRLLLCAANEMNGVAKVTMGLYSVVAPVNDPVEVDGIATEIAPEQLSLTGVVGGRTSRPRVVPPLSEPSSIVTWKVLVPVLVPAAITASNVNNPSPATWSPLVPSSNRLWVAEPPIELRSAVTVVVPEIAPPAQT